MEYYQTIHLKDGRECVLRNGTAADAKEVLDMFILTHTQTDQLLSYPEEITYTVEDEARFLAESAASDNETEILAFVDGKLAGTAGISQAGKRMKTKHRAEFGIAVDQAYWRSGVGRALTRACIDCAKRAGYDLLELEVVSDNEGALALYTAEGFREYGRKPRAFKTRTGAFQTLVLMCMEL